MRTPSDEATLLIRTARLVLERGKKDDLRTVQKECLLATVLLTLGLPMTSQEREALKLAEDALRKHMTAWITVAPVLEAHVYPDAPRWNAWTRWGARACEHAEAARRAVKAALAAREEPQPGEANVIVTDEDGTHVLTREDTERPDVRAMARASIAAVAYLFSDQIPEGLLEVLGDADDDLIDRVVKLAAVRGIERDA